MSPTIKKGVTDEGSKLYLNLNLDDLDNEIWANVLDFDGIYEVSNLGRVKSLERTVPIAKGHRRVRARILSQGKQKRDGRLSVMLSLNNIAKSYSLNTLVYYSFNPKKINADLKDEVYHINKIQDDNRLCNLDYNKIKGTSYKRSMELGNVKHLDKARKKHHPHTRNKSIIVDGRTTHRTCRVCDKLKEQKEYSYYGTNRCLECDRIAGSIYYRKRADKKGTKPQKKILIKITDIITNEVYTATNRNKCIVSKILVDRYANTGKHIIPYYNSKHENLLKVEIVDRE
tara:strand:- start:8599 stop:9456 length:858 start_codon:yes stop_codon:yes gene_type:complete